MKILAIEINEIEIHTDTIKLDQLLKFSGVIDSGGFAKQLIQEGSVLLNGEKETRRSKVLKKGDEVEIIPLEMILKVV